MGETTEEKIVERLVQRATLNVFNRHFSIGDLEELVDNFDRGLSIETSDTMSSLEYMTQASEVGGLTEAVRTLGAQGNPALRRLGDGVRSGGPAPASQAEQGPRGRLARPVPVPRVA